MIKFTDIAQGDQQGVAKVNKNFDLVEQTLNQEERKEINVPLANDWKLGTSGNNPLKIIVTPGMAWLRGDVQPKVTGDSAFGNQHPIAVLPREITFRGATYEIDLDNFFVAPIGERVNSGGASVVRIYLDDGGRLSVDESRDLIGSHAITINCLLDITRK